MSKQGFDVTIISPGKDLTGGSIAALGLLMANVFQRSSGRNWRLRQQSLALFGQWQQELEATGFEVPIQRGLWMLANSSNQFEKQQALAEKRKKENIKLETFDPIQLNNFVNSGRLPELPEGVCGALWSEFDGQLDPQQWMLALLRNGQNYGLEIIDGLVNQLKQDCGSWQVSWLGNSNDQKYSENRKFDVIISRAVAPLKDLWYWSKPILNKRTANNKQPYGLICLKGGDLAQEIFESNCKPHIWEVTKVFNEDYFENKFLLNVL